MKEIKIENGFSVSNITKGTVFDTALDNSTFTGQNLYKVELDFPAASDKWEGIRISQPPLKDISGVIAVSFDLIYKWRQELKDSWTIENRRFGKRLTDIDNLKRIAGHQSKTIEEFAAQNNIDLNKPEQPARVGSGQQFYAEFVSAGKIIDAYYLGDSEELGFKDEEALGFYGKKQVVFYIKDSNKVNLSDLSVNLYIGAPGSAYKGSVWFGNWLTKDINYAELPSELVTEQMASPRPLVVNEVTVSPIDPDLIPAAVNAMGYIKGAAESGHILYGIQNYPYSKGGLGYKDAPEQTSDIFDITGSIPSVFGFDSLSLIGMEKAFRMPEIDPQISDLSDPKNIPLYIKGSVLRSVEAWKAGAIPTLSLHMSDPAMVYDQYVKDNINPVTSRTIYNKGEKYPWNFHGYGYGNSTRTAHDTNDGRERSPHKPMLRMYRAITGQSVDSFDTGVLEVFNAYLDLTADYCLMLQEQNIPVLYRPFHENSGDWFWWGNSGCENDDGTYNPKLFKKNWQHIVEYMYKRGVHNCIYVYSPNGSDFDNEAKMYTNQFRPYVITYPGDKWVDICAFDDYTTDESAMRDDVVIVTKFAAQHGKIAAASEVTGSPVDPAITEYLFRSLTDTADLPVNIAYLLQWTPPSFGPYLISPSRANSGAVNTVIKALSSKNVVMANETNGFKPVKVNVVHK